MKRSPSAGRILANILVGLMLPTGTLAQTDTLAGEIALTMNYFPTDGFFVGQPAGGQFLSEGTLRGSDMIGSANLEFESYFRLDSRQSQTMVDLRKGYLLWVNDGFDLLLGANIETWGVVESSSVVDVINQFESSNPVDRSGKLGQPMINATINFQNGGSLGVFGLLGFRERKFGSTTVDGTGNRFRGPFQVQSDFARFESPKNKDVGVALRYSNSIPTASGALDFALSYINSTNRDPVLLPGCIKPAEIGKTACNSLNQAVLNTYRSLRPSDVAGADILDRIAANLDPDDLLLLSQLSDQGFGTMPYYQRVEKLGLEALLSSGAFQFKAEGAYSITRNENYWSAVTGFEYSLGGIGDRGASVVVAAEYLYDDRSFLQPLTLFDNDLFVGAQFSFNNSAGSLLRAGAFQDLETRARIYRLTYSQRLNDQANLELSGTLFEAGGFTDPVGFLTRGSFLSLTLRSFF